MKKIKMTKGVTLSFEEACKKYLENCRQRNLREGTIGHYKQSYTQFYKYFDSKMPIEDIDEQLYKDYVLHLKSTLDNDVSINGWYDCCCCSCYRRGKQVRGRGSLFEKSSAKTSIKIGRIMLENSNMIRPISY